MNSSGFQTIDFVIFGAYIILLVCLGLFLSRNKKGQEKNANDYFLAGNTLTWWAVGASLIAANISAEQFIGMSGSGYKIGLCVAAYELMAALALIVVGKFLLPIMITQKIYTIPQFLRECQSYTTDNGYYRHQCTHNNRTHNSLPFFLYF
jgi:SSS family solute:Na+ symporter